LTKEQKKLLLRLETFFPLGRQVRFSDPAAYRACQFYCSVYGELSRV
jgi:hypothetical protein